MALLGLLFLITGVVMNVQVLRRSRGGSLEAAELMRTPPWMVSVGLVVVGIALLLVGAR